MSDRANDSQALRPLAIEVVSVQSQVVYGRVGNTVAVPTLESFGLAVAAVPTVLLSNTPHYPTLHGGAIPLPWFGGWLADLEARDALRQLRAIVSGYLGSAAQAEALASWIRARRKAAAQLLVVVDPVIGDHDQGIYVSADLVQAQARHLTPLATGLTPNGFELQQLTGYTATDMDGVIAAARTLLGECTQWVVVTSAGPETWADGTMQVAVVTREESRVLTHPRVDTAPKGTGDLFSATLTAHLLRGASLFEAASQACERVVAALRLTHAAHSAELLLPTPA